MCVEEMYLRDVDLASVPVEHLASLASCVTGWIRIWNVSNIDLVKILDSSNCEWLRLSNQNLSTVETQAVVRAMANVEKMSFGFGGEVPLDISALVTYGGQGKCRSVRFENDSMAAMYREDIQRWATRISWTVTRDNNHKISIERK